MICKRFYEKEGTCVYLLYLFLWIIFNGSLTLEIFLIGLIVAAAIFAFVCKYMDYSLEKEKKLYLTFFKLLKYLGVVIWEIVKANIIALKLIVSEEEVVEPILVHFTTNLKTSTAKTLLANSITLTPGTITVTLEDNEYVVHCLDKSLAYGMDDSIFVKLLTEIEDLWLKN